MVINVHLGMFSADEYSRFLWFVTPAGELEAEAKSEYRLLGLLIALAVYNGVILDISFPLALYRKLLKLDVGLDDLEQVDPALHRGLNEMLDFEGDIEDVYQRTFRIQAKTVLGTIIDVDLKPDGENITVTNDNAEGFV